MDQVKIGRFIATCRKEKKLTQIQLAEKLGVSDRSVSKWENGRCLPDLSLFEPLCNELNITINELLSGEKIDKEHYEEKLEENIKDTIVYTSKKVVEKDKMISTMIFAFGLGLAFVAFTIFPSESSWGSIYSIIGVIISIIGVLKLFKEKSYIKKTLFGICYFIVAMLLLIGIDYISVKLNKVAPRFSYIIETGDKMIIYKSPLCNVYRLNRNTKNEYYIVDDKKEYNEDTIPIVPFDRDKSSIDNIIKYKNQYIGNNSNTGNLINNLPLSEYGYVFEIDSDKNGVIINYHMTDWYIIENLYLQKCLLYNSVSIFSLIDNVDYIQYNFTGNSYTINRNSIENKYPNYNDIIKDNIYNNDNFNKYVESKINDDEFVENTFKTCFKNISK